MSYTFSRADQPGLLSLLATETLTSGWKRDAVAYGLARRGADGTAGPTEAIGCFENFCGNEADFSFAMMPPNRINRGIIDAFMNLAFHHRGMNLDRLWMQASDENTLSQRLILSIGARFQFRKASSASDGSDAIVFLLTRPEPANTPAARASTD